MLTKGQLIYRFKFNFTDSGVEITHHTFEIVAVKESVRGGEPCIEYRPRCVEDYKIKYKDGYYREEDGFDFDKVKPSGDSIYVLLKENDEEKAKLLVSEYLDAKIRDIKSELDHYEEMKRYIKAAKTLFEDYENMGVFDADQLIYISEGLEEGLDVSVYADPKFDDYQMVWIRQGLKEGVDVSVYTDPKYNDEQMYEIFLGLKKGLDVSCYADPKYNEWQMTWIRTGLEEGFDVSIYADPKYDEHQMYHILEDLRKGLDVSWYADPKYDSDQMYQICRGLEEDIDVDGN